MQAQLHRPLRVALMIFGLGAVSIAYLFGGSTLRQCALVGGLSLLGLALGPTKAPAKARYLLPLLMLLPLGIHQVRTLASGLLLLLSAGALGLWAGMGLRSPKDAGPAPDSLDLWDYLALVGLFLLWLTLGLMGGTLAGLLWTGDAQASACLQASAIFTLVYHHARFYLNQPPRPPAAPPAPAPS